MTQLQGIHVSRDPMCHSPFHLGEEDAQTLGFRPRRRKHFCHVCHAAKGLCFTNGGFWNRNAEETA
jgi:hypothetical protein